MNISKFITSFVLIFSLGIKAEVFPIETWAVGNAMSGVSMSKDGKYISFMQRLSRESDPVLKIFKTSDLNADPYILGGESLEIVSASWVGNEELIVTFRGRARDDIQGFNRGVYEYRLALFSMKSKEFTKLNDRGLGSAQSSFVINLANTLKYEDNKILISYREFKRNSSFRATSYYKYNLKTGSKSLVLKGREKFGNVIFDDYGNPRYAFNFDYGTGIYTYYYRNPGDKEWKEFYALSENDFAEFSPLSFADSNSEIYVSANNGNDKAGIWKFNLETKKFVKKIYEDKDADVSGVFGYFNEYQYPDEILGIGLSKAKPERLYFNNQLALQQEAVDYQLAEIIPNSYYTRITSTSTDGSVLLIRNIGPRDPGSYYIYQNGKVDFVGSVKPNLKPEHLADVKYVVYKSRDGRNIPSYVTIPNEKKDKYPLIVMPHGGPFVQEMVIWDEWSQMLANNGYMVIQPQYRGSLGYGIDHYTSAFIDKGEGGYKMQDDKDDGVLHLINEGLVDPDRVAMFGWSYGGYAALIAASREEQLYQCVISGAPVTLNVQQLNYYRNQLRGTSILSQEKYWSESMSPLYEVEKVNVPILLIHGEDDQRVPVSHATKYVEELKKYNKGYEYIELEDADHFSNTLFYKHKINFYTRMIEYLQNDCGPEGL